MKKCPFKVGDTVVYKPSVEGRGKIMMTDLARLVPGQTYKITAVDNDVYVVVEGFEQGIPRGLYWTEFVAEPSAEAE